MFRRIIKSVPNTLTCCNLLCGALACIFAFSANETFPALWGLAGREIVWILIGGAALFDFFDGAAARLLHAPSAIGKELDSLADLVSFGVAPAMLLFNTLLPWSQSWWLPYLSLFIPVMGALRLAKFNVDESQATTFKGLPIPANAIFWIGATAWMHSHAGTWMATQPLAANAVIAATIIAVALMMVANMRMFSLKFKNFGLADNFMRYILLAAAVAFTAIFGIAGFACTIILYFILSVCANLTGKEKKQA